MKRIFLVGLSLIWLAGCAAAPLPTYFRVDFNINPENPSPPPLPLSLSVPPLESSEPLARPNILVRTSKRSLEQYQYQLWEVTPVKTASHHLTAAFKASGLFRRIDERRLATGNDLVLNGRLTRFEAVQMAEASAAEVGLWVELSTARDGRILWSGLVTRNVRAANATMEALAEAMSQALKQCVDEVVAKTGQAAKSL